MRPAIEEIDHASNEQPYQDPDPCPNSNVDDQVGVDQNAENRKIWDKWAEKPSLVSKVVPFIILIDATKSNQTAK